MRILGQKGVKKWAGKIHQKVKGTPFGNFSKSPDFLKIFWKFSEIFWNEQILGQPKLTLGARSHRDRAPTVSLGKNFQKFPEIFQKFSKIFKFWKIFKNFQILENAQNLSRSWKMLKIWANLGISKFFQFFFKKSRKLRNQLFCRNPQSIWHFSGPIGRPADQPETSPKRWPKMAD